MIFQPILDPNRDNVIGTKFTREYFERISSSKSKSFDLDGNEDIKNMDVHITRTETTSSVTGGLMLNSLACINHNKKISVKGLAKY